MRMSSGFDRDRDEFARGTKAIVVLPDQGDATRDVDARLEETAGLAAGRISQHTRQPGFRPVEGVQKLGHQQ